LPPFTQVYFTGQREKGVGPLGENGVLNGVRVVQRFVTTIYVNGNVAAKVHWISTAAGKLTGNTPDALQAQMYPVPDFDKISPEDIVNNWKNDHKYIDI
jgi:hypothetical protein